MVSAYRTVFLDAAILLTRVLSLFLLAAARKKVFERTSVLKMSGNWMLEEAAEIRSEKNVRLGRFGLAIWRVGDYQCTAMSVSL